MPSEIFTALRKVIREKNVVREKPLKAWHSVQGLSRFPAHPDSLLPSPGQFPIITPGARVVKRTCITIIALGIILAASGCGKGASSPFANPRKGELAESASLAILPGDQKLPLQKTVRLKATVTLADGYSEVVSEYATWKSSNEAVAAISSEDGSRGELKAVSPGTAVVSARFDKLLTTVHVTVTANTQEPLAGGARAVLLHERLGGAVWAGGVPEWFSSYNVEHGTSYAVTERAFPAPPAAGAKNLPFDYWSAWANAAAPQPAPGGQGLETLTQAFNVVVWKHSPLVSDVLPDTGAAQPQSSERKIENYKLQYQDLKGRMRSSPDTRFIIWTGPALVRGATGESQAKLAREFAQWVKKAWDEPGDNIYVWDFFELQTDGGVFMKDEYAAGPKDSSPNPEFARKAAAFLCRRIVDVAEGRGDTGSQAGL